MTNQTMKKSLVLFILWISTCLNAFTQGEDLLLLYDEFRKQTQENYDSFRSECNKKYAEFLRNAWNWYEGKSPIPLPKDDSPMPPQPYIEEDSAPTIETMPVQIESAEIPPQPKPIEPIREKTIQEEKYFTFDFYGLNCKVRLPNSAKLILTDTEPSDIAAAWERLSNEDLNNTIRDCLETRIRYNLCDWAYLMFLDQLAKRFCYSTNGAVLLTAFLYSQSGYKMRLGVDRDKLLLLFGSRHQIFEKGFYVIDGETFYPFDDTTNSIKICDAAFEGETSMSLIIGKEQSLGSDLTDKRAIQSKRFTDFQVESQVPLHLIEFFNSYPTSALDGDVMSRWAMYANTPLAQKTKDAIYPSFRKFIVSSTKLQAVEMLLNWVQTGFVYEYDDKVWGHDRAFFAEETLYYPYADCEDRAILFSRLVRDLLDLDVALIFYPGHLATAVCFDEDVNGSSMILGGRKFIICDPTYIGAPVGAQMPKLEYDKAQAILLNR